MKTRKTLAATLAAATLSALIAGPVFADAPTQYGVITCDAFGEQDRMMSTAGYWAEEAIVVYETVMPAMGDCEDESIGYLVLDAPA